MKPPKCWSGWPRLQVDIARLQIQNPVFSVVLCDQHKLQHIFAQFYTKHFLCCNWMKLSNASFNILPRLYKHADDLCISLSWKQGIAFENPSIVTELRE
jgi:hypothetical protein